MTSDQAVLDRFSVTVAACTHEGRILHVLAGRLPNAAPPRQRPALKMSPSPRQRSDGAPGRSVDDAARAVSASLFDLIPSGDREAIRNCWAENVAAGTSFQTEIPVGSDLDEAKWYLLDVSVATDAASDVVEPMIMLAPIDQIMRRHRRLADRARAVLDTAVDAIITIDERGVIQTANEAAQTMFGFTLRDLIGSNVNCLMPEPYRTEHDGYLRRYLRTGHAAIIGIGRKVIGRRRTGAEFPAHLAVSEFAVDSARHFTGIIRDLSDLEQAQQQLLQSERLAAIGQMVTGLAHESRNALQRAQAHLDMLSLDLQDQPEQLDLARRTRTALRDLHRLYEEVRSYAAPIQLDVRVCRLDAVWRKAWSNLQAERAGHAIQLQEPGDVGDNDPADVTCEVDGHRIEQVFRNILENAIHACCGSGTIRIRCQPVEWDSQPALAVDFQDSGPGMPDEVKERLCDPFFTTKQKGTGLGMAIAQRIVLAHRGYVTTQSVSDTGACIRVILPRKAAVRNAVR